MLTCVGKKGCKTVILEKRHPRDYAGRNQNQRIKKVAYLPRRPKGVPSPENAETIKISRKKSRDREPKSEGNPRPSCASTLTGKCMGKFIARGGGFHPKAHRRSSGDVYNEEPQIGGHHCRRTRGVSP